ncbi:cytochrome P450 monooxygenase pc-2 [Trametes coccinea BRFM310]|uniref:Cytochrome P450 monooxygenase pc-2 n=1 Tax=Trametes coccinea (strain BRFM310) TaxID=1353009 RepID=A0A1Y2IGF3_TRAC3|nr:cytochrome P450 monooxygenase pc-2 [Trametes coccinea BRFM310]
MLSHLYGRMPPGFSFLLGQLVTYFAPAMVLVLISQSLLDALLGAEAWSPSIIVAALLSVPAGCAARIFFRDWSARRRAASLGAVLPPRWDGRLIGNFDLLTDFLERFHTGYLGEGPWDRMEELGNICSVSLLWDVTYFTIDASVMKAILATDFPSFEKGEKFRDAMDSVLGKGVFNSDGELWKFHRAMTRPYFSRDRISHFELFDRHADSAIVKMKERFRLGHAVDVQDVISRFTLDSATDFLLGRCVHSLRDPLPYAHNDPQAPQTVKQQTVAEQFSTALAEAQRVISRRPRASHAWPLFEFWQDKSAKPMRIVNEFVQPILEEAIARHRAAEIERRNGSRDSKETEDGETLLDHLVKITDDPAVLRDETINILIAGKDSTAATLTFAIYMLCLNPRVFQRLRAEVFEMVGPNQMPTFDDVRKMKYLRAVINEILRFYCPIPYNIRVTNRGTTLPNPDPTAPRIFIPKDTSIAYSVLMMHHRKDYWGPDALYFDPDRWLDERLNKYFIANPLIFTPFNVGPRICLGQQFAYNEVSFLLIRLLQNFSSMELDLSARAPDARPPPEWAGAEGQKGLEKVVPKCHISLFVHGGLWVKMTEAEKEH